MIALMSLDMNGDGPGDIVRAFLQTIPGYGGGGQKQETTSLVVQTILSNGVSFEPPVTQTFISNTENGMLPNLGVASVILPAEVNGDGLPDLVIMTPSGNNPATSSTRVLPNE